MIKNYDINDKVERLHKNDDKNYNVKIITKSESIKIIIKIIKQTYFTKRESIELKMNN